MADYPGIVSHAKRISKTCFWVRHRMGLCGMRGSDFALRLSISPSDERTKAMEQVAAQMKSLGFAVQTFLSELKSSESAGERLAAVTSLEVSPNQDSLGWLVERERVKRASRDLLKSIKSRLSELDRFWEKEQHTQHVDEKTCRPVHALH